MKIAPFKYKYFDSDDELILREELTLSDSGLTYLSGKSGAGKSTFLKILKGFHPEFLPGELSGDFIPFNHALYLFQNPFNQIIHHHIKNEILFSAENEKINFVNDFAKNEELIYWLEVFGLKDIFESERSLKSLSHGENQRLLLLSLILAKPNVLFLDEPTAFLDQKNREIVYRVIYEYKKKSHVFLIDHHFQEVSHLIDQTLYFQRQNNILEVTSEKAMNNTNTTLDLGHIKIESIFKNKKLSVKNLFFGFHQDKKIISDLSFELNSGECLVLKGKSGVGKSTLFKLLLGELKLQGGVIQYPLGDAFNSCSVLFQNPELHFLFDTVEEEIRNNELVKLFPKILMLMKLENKLSTNPFLLSEGEKRRLSFLVAQNKMKPLLLLDEPTFGLDDEQVKIIQELILLYKNLGSMVLLISHDQEFYEKIANTILDIEMNEFKKRHE